MHFFAKKNFARERYKNSFDFINYMDNLARRIEFNVEAIQDELETVRSKYKSNKHYNEQHEYVVVWYRPQVKTRSNTDNSLIYVDVLLADLTSPTYIYKNKNGERVKGDAYVTVQIPINFLHSMPIGSIWKNGKSSEKFIFDSFTLEVQDNYGIYSIHKALTTQSMKEKGVWNKEAKKYEEYNGEVYPTPFNFKNYFDKIPLDDRNQLINVEFNGQKYVIHPLLLFIAHYGYSMDIKRIIGRYPIDEIDKRLAPTDERIEALAKERGLEKYIILPRDFIRRDAVFLHHYKYDVKAKELVKRIHNKIQLNKIDESKVIEVDFWHENVNLKIDGVNIDDTILCTSIRGIQEYQAEPIEIFLQPKKNVDFESEDSREFSVITSYMPPQDIEELDFVRNPVNNIIQGVIKQRLERLGELRQLNIQSNEVNIRPIGDDTTFIIYPKIDSLGVGDKQGRIGNTGYANCFFEVSENDFKNSRFHRVWEDAKSYANSKDGIAQWFTYERGFNSDDDFYVLSLKKFHSVGYDLDLPKNVLVIRLVIAEQTYFILEFGEDLLGNTLKGYKGIAYKQKTNEKFLEDFDNGLIDLLSQIVTLNGSINSDFIDYYKGNIATFKHMDNKNSNCVRNGIEKFG